MNKNTALFMSLAAGGLIGYSLIKSYRVRNTKDKSNEKVLKSEEKNLLSKGLVYERML